MTPSSRSAVIPPATCAVPNTNRMSACTTNSGMMPERAASTGVMKLRVPMELTIATMNPAMSRVSSKAMPALRRRSRAWQ